MNKKITIIIAMATAFLFLAGGMSFAGYGNGNGGGKGSGKCGGSGDQKRLRDGSCQSLAPTNTDAATLAASKTQSQKRLRKKDGSCLTSARTDAASMYLAAGKNGTGQNGARQGDRDGTPDQDRLKDGSCQKS